ncbi:MAG: cell division protein FtsQ/DivIB [Tenacibaculum sp.]
MKKIAVYILFIHLVVFLIFLHKFAAKKNQLKTVKNTVIAFEQGDNNFLSHNLVNKLLTEDKKYVHNQLKSAVDLHFFETKILSNPYVEKASVFLTIEGILYALIKQRKPLARVFAKDSVYYIDKQGFKMPLSTNFSARVPLVFGVSKIDEIKEVLQLLSFIYADSFFKKEIISIERNPKGDYIFSARTGRHKIVFGRVKQAAIKFKKLKAFYSKAIASGAIKRYKTINIKYHNQIVCTKI